MIPGGRVERQNYFVATGLRHGLSVGSAFGEIQRRNTHVEVNVDLVRTGVRIPPPPPFKNPSIQGVFESPLRNEPASNMLDSVEWCKVGCNRFCMRVSFESP